MTAWTFQLHALNGTRRLVRSADVPEAATLLKMLVSLFAIVNPIGTAPLYLGMTGSFSNDERKKIAKNAAFTCAIVLFIVALVGQWMLALFGISVASFRVIGGIVFLLMAIDMLNVRPSRTKMTPEEESEATEVGERRQLAIVPLGVPMLAGPGAISTILLYSNENPDVAWRLTVYGVIAVVCFASWLVLAGAAPLGRLLGTTGINILTRLMGLIVGAIGAESLTAGLRALMPGLG